MRKIIEKYTFDKVNKTITFLDYFLIDLNKLFLIVDVTNGKTIFQANRFDLSGTVSTNVLTLTYDTNTVDFNNTDSLQIFYEEQSIISDITGSVPSQSYIQCGRNSSGSMQPLLLTDEGINLNANSQITLTGSLNSNGAILGPIDCNELSSLFLRLHSNGAGINITYTIEQCDLIDFSSNVFTTISNPSLSSANTNVSVATTNLTTTTSAATPIIIQLAVVARFVRLRVTAYSSGTLVSVFKGYRNTNLPQSINIASQPAITIASSQTLGTVTTVSALTNLGAPSVNTDVTSSARTSSGNSGTINDVSNGRSISATVNCTSSSGTTPTLDIILEESYDNGTTWVGVYHFTRIVSSAQGIRNMSMIPLGGRRRWRWEIGGTTPSFTFSINVMRSNGRFPLRKQFFIRNSSILSASASTVSSAFPIDGCKFVGAVFNSLTATETGSFKMQFSMDGAVGSWYDVTPAVGIQSSSMTYLTSSNNVLGNFARIFCAASGSGHTLSYVGIVASE